MEDSDITTAQERRTTAPRFIITTRQNHEEDDRKKSRWERNFQTAGVVRLCKALDLTRAQTTTFPTIIFDETPKSKDNNET
jgi:hypothetical protein